MDQRLFTSESGCGYRYGPSVRDEISGRSSMRIIRAPNGAESAPLSLCVQTPFSNWNVIRGVSNVKEKRKLSSGLTTLRPSVVNCFAASNPHRRVSECWTEFPVPRCLRARRACKHTLLVARPFQGGFPRGLGPTNPCPSTVHMETDSASIFCVLHRIIATTTKICTGCTVHLGSRRRLLPVLHAPLRGGGLYLPQRRWTIGALLKHRPFWELEIGRAHV